MGKIASFTLNSHQMCEFSTHCKAFVIHSCKYSHWAERIIVRFPGVYFPITRMYLPALRLFGICKKKMNAEPETTQKMLAC